MKRVVEVVEHHGALVDGLLTVTGNAEGQLDFTDENEQALGYLKRFGSVTVLNGHVHQIMQKVEGNVTFHTARSTAYPQPAPGTAPAPGPIKDVPADKLRSMLGLTDVNYVAKGNQLAVVDETLV